MKIRNNKLIKIFPVIIFFVSLIMAVGYASINSVLMNFGGESFALELKGVYITSIEQVVNDSSEKIDINYAGPTIVNSEVTLDSSNVDSTVRLMITVHNSSKDTYVYMGEFLDNSFYDNNNILYSVVGLKLDDQILAGDYLTFYVDFSFKDKTNISNNVLNSIIDYRFEPFVVKETLSGIEFNYQLKNSEYAPEGDVYEYYSIDANRAIDNTVKIIVFGKTSDYINEVSGLVKEPIDVYRTGSISMYRKTLSDGMFKIYILSDTGNFKLNPNAAWMFDKLYDLEYIYNLHLLDTSNVTNMRDMFCDCAKLKYVDLSNFNTENVTNMIGMFARMEEITYLDLTSFDTKNVTEVRQMFSDAILLKSIYVSDKWKLPTSFEGTLGNDVFMNCTNLIGGNGTIYDEDGYQFDKAVIDGNGKVGYLTGSYKLDTGIYVNHIIKNKTASEIEGWTLSTRFVDSSVKKVIFGRTRDYNNIVNNYVGKAIDSNRSGVISAYRVSNGNGYDVYILSNSGKFEANVDSAWFFDNLMLLEDIVNLNMLDTSKVQNMRDFFCDAQTLNHLDLSEFSTESATSFEGMFARMYNIEILDLSNFNTSKVTNMKSMFHHAVSATEAHPNYQNIVPKLKTVYVSDKWSIANIAATEIVFTDVVNLVGGNGTVFDSSNRTVLYATIDTSSNPGYFTKKGFDVTTFDYTGSYKMFRVPETGTYKIELWGAQGGSYGNQGGLGAYTSGLISLNKDEELFVHVGGQATSITGGYNGGGNGSASYNAVGGGGATDVRVGSNTLYSRIMVAGAGGGSDYYASVGSAGGAGGGLTGLSGSFYRSAGTNTYTVATGGTQTSGGIGAVGYAAASNGTFGIGGNSYHNHGSGGGGGYFGGGGGSYNSSVVGTGGGGSSYISGHTGCVAIKSSTSIEPRNGTNEEICAIGTTDNLCSEHYSGKKFTNTVMIAGNASMPNPFGTTNIVGKTGNGYARITIIR